MLIAEEQKENKKANAEKMVQLAHEHLLLLGQASDIGEEKSDDNRLWNDIVFENRNKEYGAYVLRKDYSKAVTIGFIITLTLFTLLLSAGRIVEFFKGEEEKPEVVLKKLVYSQLSAPPPIDKPKPLPPQIQLPKLQKVIKFVPPKVVKEQVIDESPTIEEIKENETAAVAVDGAVDFVLDEPVEQIMAEDENEIFTVVEQNPEFPGGYDAMMAFVKQNMKYPANARRMQIEGTVYVGFVVNKDGSISDVKVLKGIMTECDNEAIRVIKLMPNWVPGKQNGRKVNVRFTVPLKFRMR